MREDVIRAHAELPVAVRAHPSAAAVGLERGAQADAPHLHARALPRPRRADPRARARLRADDRHHRRLPRRDRGGLRADARGRRGGRLRRRVHVHLLAAPRDRGGDACRTRCRTRSRCERMERLVEVVQRRAPRARAAVRRAHARGARRGPVAHRPEPPARPLAPQQGRELQRPRARPASSSRSRSPPRRARRSPGEESILAARGRAEPAAWPPRLDGSGKCSLRLPERRGRSVRHVCEHMFDAVEQPGSVEAEERRARLPGYRDGRGRAPLRRARGARDALLRGPGEVDPQPGAGGVADAVPLDDQPVPRLHPRVRVLLRAPDPHVPRLRRRPRLRARDRRQGQRAGAAAGRAGAAVVEARARRARARTPIRTSGSRAATS